MSTSKSSKELATWDGEPSTWGDYSRRVRLHWEMTPRHKRARLGPELASRLTARAWAITPSLDHRRLGKRNGTKYLLKFLKERLCRTAVPDAGARLEDLLIRLKRPLGMPMSQWANEVMEAYRKVQRALIRARQQQRGKEVDEKATVSEPHREPPSRPTSPTMRSPSRPRRPTSSPTGRPPTSPTSRMQDAGDGEAHQDEGDGRGDYEPVPEESEPDPGHEDWTEEQWKTWRKQRRQEWYEDDETSSGEDYPWDELQTENLEVLPDEILGWLLLRRANLSAASRLSVQASVNNSLKFGDLEVALRDQEEELLQADANRSGGQGRRRSFWVEEDGNWGLLTSAEDTLDDGAEIHWVGNQLPADVYAPSSYSTEEHYEDDEVYWHFDYDGWHGYVRDGEGYWLETDGYGIYWSLDEPETEGFCAEEKKELEEAYAVYENKMNTFKQSRNFQRAKGVSRGFYPLSMMKGKKGSGKGKKGKKGKGFNTTSSPSSTASPKPLFAAQGSDGSTTTSGTGCFVCGDRGHGFRNCPKRSSTSTSSTFGKGTKKGTFWVESMTSSPLAFIGMVLREEEVLYNTEGYGVLDLGYRDSGKLGGCGEPDAASSSTSWRRRSG